MHDNLTVARPQEFAVLCNFSLPRVLDSEVLASALRTIRERNIPIHSVLIERDGYVILDTYFFPFKDKEKYEIRLVFQDQQVEVKLGERSDVIKESVFQGHQQ
jgi:hypothetical protein